MAFGKKKKKKHLIRVMGHGFPSCYFSKDGIGSKKGPWKLGELNINHWHGMLQNPVREVRLNVGRTVWL